MTIIQPSILPGFMELLPADQLLFNDIKKIIEDNFIKFAFLPLDTPAIEKDEILFAKGGGETSKQVFSIQKKDSSRDQSLRFDLTVPLARYVAQYESSLTFPFRRYQIGKVYRGERNQKGRYREFYQADIDIVGRESLAIINDAEMPAVIYSIFKDLGLEDIKIHINNRKLLSGFLKIIGIDNSEALFRLIDKIKKISTEEFFKEMKQMGLTKDQQEDLILFIKEDDNDKILDRLKDIEDSLHEGGGASDLFMEGLSELRELYKDMHLFGVNKEHIVIDLSISRGLDYYTGSVYETFIDGYESIGSVASGGRYDDLASNFSKQKFPGVGISIGLTRLFYQLTEAGLIKNKRINYIDAVIIAMSKDQQEAAIELAADLRKQGIKCQIYSEEGKMKKKFSYVDALASPYALILGENEIRDKLISVKDMKSGDQEMLSFDRVLEILKK